MTINIKDFASGSAVVVKSSTDGVNGEVTHHNIDNSVLPTGAATSALQDVTNAALGAPADAEATGNGSQIAILKRLRTLLSGLLGVVPQMGGGGHASVQTANPGTGYALLAAQACKQVTIINDTGTTILVQQGGAGVGVPVFDQTAFTFFGLTNANNLGVKRKDDSNTQVTVALRWEA